MELAETYRTIRRHYSNLVHRTKMSSWRQFITDRGNDEAYGVAYRILRKKITADDTMSSLGTDGDYSQTWEESANRLLHALIPTAPPDENY